MSPRGNGQGQLPDVCSSCQLTMDDDNGLIQCERCQKWVCRKCADISHEEFVVISHNGRFHWFCDDCDLLAMAAVENSKKVDGKKVNISQCDMQRLVLSRVTKIMDKIETQNDLHLLQTEKITSSYADALRRTMSLPMNYVASCPRSTRIWKK